MRDRRSVDGVRSSAGTTRRVLAGAALTAGLVVTAQANPLVNVLPAQAAGTIQVTTTQQEVNNDSDCSLQEAIFAANFDKSLAIDPNNLNGQPITTGCTAGNGADTIVLQAGAVYQMSTIVQNQFSVAGFVATPDIRSEVIIEGNGARLEFVGGNPNFPNVRAFAVNRGNGVEVAFDGPAPPWGPGNPVEPPSNPMPNGSLTLKNVHIKGFSAKGGDGADGGGGGLGAGGAIYVRRGDLTVDNVTFEDNSVTGGDGGSGVSTLGGGGGGGIGGDGGGQGTDGDFRGGGGGGGSRGIGEVGGASGAGGGGTANNGTTGTSGLGGNGGFNCGGGGGDFNPSAVSGANGFCIGGGGGGGATATSAGTPTAGSGGNGNYGGGGGGGGGAGGSGTVNGGNGGNGGFGGGGGSGGALAGAGSSGDGGDGGFGAGGGSGASGANDGSGGLWAGNAGGGNGGGGAGLGGAIFSDSGHVVIRNSTFVGNTADGGARGGGGATSGNGLGGAIYAHEGILDIRNSTINGNTATPAPGLGASAGAVNVDGGGQFRLYNTIIANNGPQECIVFTTGTVDEAGSGNLIENNGVNPFACPGVAETDDPGLGPLQLNSPGNTPTMAITSLTSSAFDTGDDGTCLTTDQRGVSRIQNAHCDIGAYEAEVADLSIRKSADLDTAIAGAPLSYRITVYNNGPGVARDAVVTDTLPSGAIYAGDTAVTNPPGGCSVVGQTVTCVLADIQPYDSAEFEIRVVIDANYVDADADGFKSIVNTATVDGVLDPYMLNNASTDVTIVASQADVSIATVASPHNSVITGQNITYTITVTNQGPSYARHLGLNDFTVGYPDGPNPAELDMFQIVTVLDDPNRTDSCVITPGFGTNTKSSNISCTLIDAHPGGGTATDGLEPLGNSVSPAPSPNTGRWTITVVAKPRHPGTMTNTVQVYSGRTGLVGTPDPNLTNNLATHTVTVLPATDLQTFAVFGAEVQTNGLQGKTLNTNVVTAMPDPACCNFGGTTVTAGRRIQWDGTVVVTSPNDARGVRLEALLPAGTSLIENTLTSIFTGSAPGRCWTESAGERRTKVTCDFGTIRGTAYTDPSVTHQGRMQFVLLVDPDVPPGTQLSIDMRGFSEEYETNTSNNISGIQFDSNAWADLSLAKTGLGPDRWISGEERTIRYDIDNKGPSLAKDVVVTDPLPDELEYLAAYLGGDEGQGGIPIPCTLSSENELECKLGDMAPADLTKRLFVHVKVRADVPDGDTVNSTAEVSSDTPDPFLSDNTDDAPKTVTIEADLTVAITTTSDFFPEPLFHVIAPGIVSQSLLQEYTIIPTNLGPSDAQKVLTVVTLPPADVATFIFDDANCSLFDRTLRCPQGTLAAGASEPFHVILDLNHDHLFVTLDAEVGIDEDQDLVLDGYDDCDQTPAGTAVDTRGCPAPDLDGDRVVDASDSCPGTPVGVAVDTTGCPAPDADGDGVRDGLDVCPATPGGTLVDLEGCPDEDQDQIQDSIDECPGTPENTSVTVFGCPIDPDLANNTAIKTLVKADGELPETGAGTDGLLVTGLWMLLGGVALVLFGGRRRRVLTARVQGGDGR